MSIPIRVIPNFITLVECEEWILRINELEQARASDFVTYSSGSSHRIAMQFGEKDYGDSSPRPTLDVLGDRTAIALELFSRVVKSTRDHLHPGELFVSVFWLAKQYPGSRIDIHEDTDDGADFHLSVSSLIYLNSQSSDGELSFPEFNYKYKPQAGDLVMFDSVLAGMHSVSTIKEDRYSLPIWMTSNKSHQLLMVR
jgi:hypothetical protein